MGPIRPMKKLPGRTAARRRPVLRALGSAAAAVLAVHLIGLAYFAARIAALTSADPPVTAIMRVRGDSAPLDPALDSPLGQYPPLLKDLVLAAEDARFFAHGALDFESIRFALELNRERGRIVYGGSTISQQLARTLFLWPDRSWTRKYLEAWIALELEALLGKNRILELYLNRAEWGDHVYGARRAALAAYGREPGALDPDETARLAAVLPAPRTVAPAAVDTDPGLAERYRRLAALAAALARRPPEIRSSLERVD
jgi:monofunctional biosynthetic peptidoglycan transglycosylase